MTCCRVRLTCGLRNEVFLGRILPNGKDNLPRLGPPHQSSALGRLLVLHNDNDSGRVVGTGPSVEDSSRGGEDLAARVDDAVRVRDARRLNGGHFLLDVDDEEGSAVVRHDA